uniref:ADP/ATP translocase n=1 Tax=Magallana gigas TaxID=29159 RepID=A0A8W8NQ55_MAGGI
MSSKKLSFAENFALSGAAAIISKTAAAPIERIKLLVQNQDEMLKAGRLSEPYKGVIDCTVRTYKTEGFLPFWRGNMANCIRYFPTQALNFAFKDKIKQIFKASKQDSYMLGFAKNIGSGGLAGANILRGVAGAGVLAGFDKFQALYIAWRLGNEKK